MSPELKNRMLAIALLMLAWAGLIYLKAALPAQATDWNSIIAQVQVLLGGVVGYHVGTGAVVPAAPALASPAQPAVMATAQTGFARLPLLALTAAGALAVSLLAGCANPPTGDQVQAIRNACAFDAGLRPTVTMLLAVPDLATPEEIGAVAAARAVIDPICANPAGAPQENAIAAVSGASATIVGVVTQLQMRKAAAK